MTPTRMTTKAMASACRRPVVPSSVQTLFLPSATVCYSLSSSSAAAAYRPRPFHTLAAKMTSTAQFYDFKPLDKKGQAYPLEGLKGKVVLVVNTASKCGFTPQFGALEQLYKDIKGSSSSSSPDDFVILGFPCNQFGSQDPGTNDEIQSFCLLNYGVTFPVLGKVDVNGNHADPLWEWLKASQPGLFGMKRIKWNFEKFLIGRDGTVKGRWASTTKPESLKGAIENEPATST